MPQCTTACLPGPADPSAAVGLGTGGNRAGSPGRAPGSVPRDRLHIGAPGCLESSYRRERDGAGDLAARPGFRSSTAGSAPVRRGSDAGAGSGAGSPGVHPGGRRRASGTIMRSPRRPDRDLWHLITSLAWAAGPRAGSARAEALDPQADPRPAGRRRDLRRSTGQGVLRKGHRSAPPPRRTWPYPSVVSQRCWPPQKGQGRLAGQTAAVPPHRDVAAFEH